MKSLRKITFIVFTSLLAAFFTAGCNTMKGIGKDTERAGEKIQEKATR